MDEKEFDIQDEIDRCWEEYHEQRNQEALAIAETEEIIPDLEVYQDELSAAIEYGKKMASIKAQNVAAGVKNALIKIGFDETKVATFYLVSLITNIYYAYDYLEKNNVFNVPVELLEYYCYFSLDNSDTAIYDIIASDLFDKSKNIVKSINDAKNSLNFNSVSISELALSVIEDLKENPEQIIAKRKK